MLATFWHLLVAMATIVIAGKVLGLVFRALHQPPVIGQIVAGILVGPSLLGLVSPAAFQYLLPASVVPPLNLLAQVGVIVYMFLVGLELNPGLLRGQVRAVAWISTASIVIPFVLGSGLAVYLYPRLSSQSVPFTHFTLFLGIAMSITAFPVLARILADQRLTHTRLGVMALTCAAANDVAAWCLLALVVGVVQAPTQSALLTTALTAIFIALMVLLARPAVRALAASGSTTYGRQAFVLVLMSASALTTQAIGVHAILGAFLFGAIIPHDSPLAEALVHGLERTTLLMLPAFFALTGLRTEIGLVTGAAPWLMVTLIVLTATVGKFGGTLTAARVNGIDWRHAAGLGVLMNTRGLMELIVLNVGLDLGVVSPTLFTMLVLMALVTTLATTPILRRLFSASA